MPLSVALIIFIAELSLVSLLTIALHRLSPRWGLAPLLIFLGAQTTALGLSLFGMIDIEVGAQWVNLSLGAFLILPNLLLGLLIIYIVNGSHQARNALAGIVLISLAIGAIQFIPAAHFIFKGLSVNFQPQPAADRLVPFLLAFVLGVDMLVLILIYQWISNSRRSFPSLIASGSALFAAVCTDALLYPLLISSGPAMRTLEWGVHLGGKVLAVMVIWPWLALYLRRFAPSLPDSAAAYPRGILEILTTGTKLTPTSSRQSNLLLTLIQIDQLIVRSENPQELLDQTCQQLVNHGANQLAWIGLVDLEATQIRIHARAGIVKGDLDQDLIQYPEQSAILEPCWQAIEKAEAVVIPDIPVGDGLDSWQELSLKSGFHSIAALPMRRGGYVLGTLNVYAAPKNAFMPEEVRLLQQLADDLAYALVNLEARQQQLTLHSAAENMQDGLIIANMDGQIVYANQATTELVGRNNNELEKMSVQELLHTPTRPDLIDTQLHSLKQSGRVAFDYEFILPGQEPRYYAVRASNLYATALEASYLVINLSDRTDQHRYERQLEILNRFVTEMIDAHSLPALVKIVFRAGETLLRSKAGALYLLTTDRKAISEQYLDELPQDYAELAVFNPDLPFSTVLQTGQPVLVPDIGSDATYGEHLQFLKTDYYNSLMTLPVLYHRESIGVLVFIHSEPHAFTFRDLQLGNTLARTLAVTMQNLRLYQAEHTQRQFAEALVEAGRVLNSSLDLDEVLDHIMRQTISVIGCRAVNVMLIENNQARVVRSLDVTKPEETKPFAPRRLPLSTPTLVAMLNSRQPLIIPNTQEDERWYQDNLSAWIRSYAAAPLTLQDEVIGFLNMNSDQVNYFSPGVSGQMQAFAAAAATAIQNARLYQDLEQYSLDLEERVRARTSELSHAKEQIEQILAAVPDAVFVLDNEQRLEQANPAGETLLLTARENDIDLFAADFLQALQQGRLPIERAVLEVQERAYQAAVSILPLPDDLQGSVVVYRDVTRFRELDEMKTRFVSDVSHELRTPLTNLTLYLELMSMVKDPARHQDYLATLRRETERLTNLIEDLLTISRLEAGRVEINIEPVDIPELVNHLVNDRIPMATQRELTMTCSMAPNLPRAWADSRLLSQVLSNLLTNALNYTNSGGAIHLHSALKNGDDNSWVTIGVKDNGLGIEPDEMKYLFVRFFRGTASESTGAEGTGLGLAISKEMVESFDGRISVESQPGHGSTFTVWLKAVL